MSDDNTKPGYRVYWTNPFDFEIFGSDLQAAHNKFEEKVYSNRYVHVVMYHWDGKDNLDIIREWRPE